MELPNTLTYGYVTGRYLLAVGDTTMDADRLPEAVPALGSIRFSPLTTRIITGPPVPTTIVPQAVGADIQPDGFMYDQTGAIGVWLIAGIYNVTFSFQQVSLPGFQIEVKATHTLENPLDLTLSAELVPSPAHIFVVNQQVYNDTLAVAGGMVVTGAVVGDNLVLTRRDGTTVSAGNVRGPAGPAEVRVGPTPPTFVAQGIWVKTGLGPLGADFAVLFEDGL